MASHSYLGINEVGIRSRNRLLHEGDVVDMVLLPLRSVVLFPNESVPLRIRNHSYIAAIERMLRGEGEGELRQGDRVTSTSAASPYSPSSFTRRGSADDTTAIHHAPPSTSTPSHLGIVNLSDSDTAITVGFVGTT